MQSDIPRKGGTSFVATLLRLANGSGEAFSAITSKIRAHMGATHDPQAKLSSFFFHGRK
jgi:hypothetical protein